MTCRFLLPLWLALTTGAFATSSLPVVDHLNYTTGNLGSVGSAGNWNSSSTAITVVSNNLDGTGLGLPASSGNMAAMTASTGGTYNLFASASGDITSGKVYCSFLLRVTDTNTVSTTGEIPIALNLQNSASTRYAALYFRYVAGEVWLGVAKNAGNPAYITNGPGSNLGDGNTYFVVFSQEFITNGTSDDVVKLWVNPASLGGAEDANPSAVAPGAPDVTSATGIGRLQVSGGVGCNVDEIRIGTTWADVAPGANSPAPTNTAPVITNALMTVDGFELTGTNGLPNAFYHVLASSNLSSWPALATNVFDAAGSFDATLPPSSAPLQFFRLLVPGGGTPPAFTSQPQSASVIAGQNAILSASASGTAPLGYQWSFNSAPLPGATNASFTVTNAQSDDIGGYFVSAANNVGLVNSTSAVLTVIFPPAITTQPQGQTLSQGQDANFAVVATGTAPLRYQWYFNTNTVLANATNASLAITNVQSTNGGTYSVVLTNAAGAATSSIVTLTVNAGPTGPTITAQPQAQAVTIGQNATFTVGASGTLPLSYRWFFNTNTLLGSTVASLTVTNAQTNNAGGYSVIVTNNYGAATSSVASLTVSAASTNTGMVGYVTVGYSPTGGLGGATQTVTTAAAFTAAVTSTQKLVIYVSGTLDIGASTVNMSKKGNKTIIGLGTNATLIGNLGIKHCTNVIVRNLAFTNPNSVGDGDGVTIQYSDHVWVDHCTFYDCGDGSLDVTHGSDFVTVSWCKFLYTFNSGHNFVNLIGHSDNNASEDTGKLHVTFAYNWWSTLCVERMPRVRFGRVHVFNNYVNAPGNNYCVRSSLSAEVLVENNFYENIDSPYEYFSPNGLIRAVGNTTVNCTGVAAFNDGVFTPPYTYTLETPATAKASILTGAGAGTSLFP